MHWLNDTRIENVLARYRMRRNTEPAGTLLPLRPTPQDVDLDENVPSASEDAEPGDDVIIEQLAKWLMQGDQRVTRDTAMHLAHALLAGAKASRDGVPRANNPYCGGSTDVRHIFWADGHTFADRIFSGLVPWDW